VFEDEERDWRSTRPRTSDVLVPDNEFDDPPRSSLAPLPPPLSSAEPPTTPLDLHSLSLLLGPPTPSEDHRSAVGGVLAATLLLLVVALIVVVGVGYVVLGAALDMAASRTWLSTALVVFVVHAAVVDPLRIVCIAFFWTVFRHHLMP